MNLVAHIKTFSLHRYRTISNRFNCTQKNVSLSQTFPPKSRLSQNITYKHQWRHTKVETYLNDIQQTNYIVLSFRELDTHHVAFLQNRERNSSSRYMFEKENFHFSLFWTVKWNGREKLKKHEGVLIIKEKNML